MKLYKSIKKKKGYENKPNQNRKIQLLDYCRGGVVDNFKICVMKELEQKEESVLIQSSIEGNVIWSKPKQETLEEVLKNELEFIHNSCRNFDFDLGFKTGGLIGAKWQQERMYSEKEVLELLLNCPTNTEKETIEWFEQFKKLIK